MVFLLFSVSEETQVSSPDLYPCPQVWVACHHSTTIINNTTPPHFTATSNAGQNHTNTMENSMASTWRGAGIQGTPEVFSFYSIVLIIYIVSQPPPCKGKPLTKPPKSFGSLRTIFEAFEPSSSRHFICLVMSHDVQSLQTFKPRDTSRPFPLFSFIPFISLIIPFAFHLCLTYI